MTDETLVRPGGEVTFGKVRAGDVVTLKTANSSYKFVMTDVAVRRGVLTGGRLGRRGVTAYPGAPRLAAGARALFFIESGREFLRLTTSVVRELFHHRDGAGDMRCLAVEFSGGG